MSRTVGTITGGTDSSLAAAIHTALVAHAAWQHVEDVAGSGSLAGYTLRVYKCLGTVNSYGTDFFVIIAHNGDAYLNFGLAEQYDSATDQVTNYADNTATSRATGAAAQLSGGNPSSVNSTNVVSTGTVGSGIYLSTPATTFDYNISVTNDRLIVGTSAIEAFATFYIGLYESHVVVANEFPIVMVMLLTSSNTGGRTTRHPGRVSQTANADHFRVYGVSVATAWPPPAWNFAATSPDAFHGRPIAVTPALIGSFGSGGSVTGQFRGFFKDLKAIRGDSGVAFGDTYTFGGVTYEVVGTSGSTLQVLVRNDI